MHTPNDIRYSVGFLGSKLVENIPAGTPVVPADNRPKGGYWVKQWEGMSYAARCYESAYGFHVTRDQVTDLEDEKLAALFLDWVNNFISLEKFASHHGMSVMDAGLAIHQGRFVHHRNIAEKTN